MLDTCANTNPTVSARNAFADIQRPKTPGLI